MKDLSNAQVTIVGLGLMGGSLAGALRGKCSAVVGVARRAASIDAALERALIDWGTTDVAQGVAEADIVVLATPVRVILQQLPQIAALVPENCLLIDLGSTKTEIIAAMADLPDHVQPLGGHPMCGKELSGIEVAEPTLYQGRTFILTPLPRTAPQALALGHALAEAIGAHPLVLDGGRQDFLVATLSHLPYLLACTLVATADATTSADPAAWEIVAGGFRDTSRVAGSDVQMMTDILLTNREEVLRAVDTFAQKLDELRKLVDSGSEADMQATLNAIRAIRHDMFP